MPTHAAPRNRGPKSVKIDPSHILEAAQTIFAVKGLRGASLRAIAQEAGCDPALIYYHFDSKEAMFMALLDRTLTPLTAELTALADPKDARHTFLRLQHMLEIVRRHFAQDAGLRAIMRGEAVGGAEQIKDQIAEPVRKLQTQIWALLRQGIQRGHLRPDLNVRLAGFFFARMYMEIWDLVPAFAQRFIQVPSTEAVREAEQTWLDFFWHGAAAHPEQPVPQEKP